MWLKISCALTFWFGNSNVTTFQTGENVKISIFPFKLSREKCYIFKSILRIFKNILFAERWQKVGIVGWKFLVHRYFGFAIATLQLFQNPENVKISIFPLHCPGRNAISSKVFNEFSKSFFWLKDEECGYWCWKSLVHRYFSFKAIATLQLSKIQKM